MNCQHRWKYLIENYNRHLLVFDDLTLHLEAIFPRRVTSSPLKIEVPHMRRLYFGDHLSLALFISHVDFSHEKPSFSHVFMVPTKPILCGRIIESPLFRASTMSHLCIHGFCFTSHCIVSQYSIHLCIPFIPCFPFWPSVILSTIPSRVKSVTVKSTMHLIL